MSGNTRKNPHRGKPVFFLGAVMGGWVVARGGMVLMTPVPEVAFLPSHPVLTVVQHDAGIGTEKAPPMAREPRTHAQVASHYVTTSALAHPSLQQGSPPGARPSRIAHMTAAATPPSLPRPDTVTTVPLAPPSGWLRGDSMPPPAVNPFPAAHRTKTHSASRPTITPQSWAATGWLLWRPGRLGADPATGVSLPLYGGSQAGARLSYRVSERHRLETYLRASAPLALSQGKEIAIGAAIQPAASVNARIAVEQRIRLNRAADRSATAIMAYGGFGPAPIGPVEMEGYAQAGVVGLKHPVGFADGSLALRKQVATFGVVKAHIGAGLWGGVQPGAGRLDAGPRISLDVQGQARVRVAVDWRQRLAGSATPASGPALSIGTDF